MSNPVGRSSNSPHSEPNPPPQQSVFAKVSLIFKEVFSVSREALGSPNRYFNVDSSAKRILQGWVDSQPEEAKEQAKLIRNILLKKDLSKPFELDASACNLNEIEFLPNILQNCTKLNCSGFTILKALPELPVCKILDCNNCMSLKELPALPVCIELHCNGCKNLEKLPALPPRADIEHYGCDKLPPMPTRPRNGGWEY
ncbi:MAG: hypothetical protein EB053_06490 [Chlamydiae bacterium]|nr:hypothetical protein [Chlamydiota bacterium]